MATMSKDIKHIDLAEFREAGFLQEANRLFFHPHGLALEVVVDDDGSVMLGGVWDYREDPEGVAYGDLSDQDSADKALRVHDELERHRAAREKMFGHIFQPIGSVLDAQGD